MMTGAVLLHGPVLDQAEPAAPLGLAGLLAESIVPRSEIARRIDLVRAEG